MRLRYGFCTGFATEPLFAIDNDMEQSVSDWGYDFIEYPLMSIVSLPDPEFEALMKRKTACKISCDCMANLFPAAVPVIGSNVSEKSIREYLDKAFFRASALGVRKLVFGSAGARKLGNFDKSAADQQFLRCLDILEEYCGRFNMLVLIEAIRHGEADYINTLQEAASFAREARRNGAKHIGLMADLFHMNENRESLSSLEENLDLIQHIHVCESNRQLPGDSFSSYLIEAFGILNDHSYDGSVSYESVRPVSDVEGRRTAKLLREAV